MEKKERYENLYRKICGLKPPIFDKGLKSLIPHSVLHAG